MMFLVDLMYFQLLVGPEKVVFGIASQKWLMDTLACLLHMQKSLCSFFVLFLSGVSLFCPLVGALDKHMKISPIGVSLLSRTTFLPACRRFGQADETLLRIF